VVAKMNIPESILDKQNRLKLEILENSKILQILEKYIALCKPEKVTVITDSNDDINYVRQLSLNNGEEVLLSKEGHTIHFDGYFDQARDKENTKILLSPEQKCSPHVNTMNRNKGLAEIFEIMDGCMKGKEALVRFFCLGPKNSLFTLLALQITDSAYVAHSEDLLYRRGYEEFRNNKEADFFHFVHSAGVLEGGVSKDIEKRRVYVDLKENRVLSVNNQYGGNSIGLKKLALRLAINKAIGEGWLTEHMFIMGVLPPGKNRKTYMLGAYPSMSGKTSTAMIPGQTIVGDDIAYIRINDQGEARAVNIESGIFGIIENVNHTDDPFIFEVLSNPNEIIYSNVLVKDGIPYWSGMGQDIPEEGTNFSGQWFKGKTDKTGKTILPSHPNARYTLEISNLENVDPLLNDPNGVPFQSILYGGRDSDTAVPIFQSFSWAHGVFVGASLESETTAATLGAEGVRTLQPMANLDFVVVPLGHYVRAHIDFGKRIKKPISIFAVNYFLRDEQGKYYDDKVDKKVWLMWAEGRINGDYTAIKTPIGYIPKYEDLRELFKTIFNKEYTKSRYEGEFSIRIEKFLQKMDRIEEAYRNEVDMPQEFFEEINMQRKRLMEAKEQYKSTNIQPSQFL
jgi:phosphoenolpyruvate carboxykinase (GTP)